MESGELSNASLRMLRDTFSQGLKHNIERVRGKRTYPKDIIAQKC